jgi:glutathione S-transferase
VDLFESGALLLYLNDKYDDGDTVDKWSAIYPWVVWADVSLDPIIFKGNENGEVTETKAGTENSRPRFLDTLLC